MFFDNNDGYSDWIVWRCLPVSACALIGQVLQCVQNTNRICANGLFEVDFHTLIVPSCGRHLVCLFVLR